MRRNLLIAALALGGCSLFHEPYPDRACQSDPDCWMGQKEYCNRTTYLCEPKPDAAPRIDAAPRPDAPPPADAGIDSDLEPIFPDAGPDAEAADASIDATP